MLLLVADEGSRARFGVAGGRVMNGLGSLVMRHAVRQRQPRRSQGGDESDAEHKGASESSPTHDHANLVAHERRSKADRQGTEGAYGRQVPRATFGTKLSIPRDG